MEAVLKIGGSLAEDQKRLEDLCNALNFLAKVHKITVVPGGGEFADTVRRFDNMYGLSGMIAHKMAILAMDLFGLLLSDLIADSYVSFDIDEISNFDKDLLPIFLPSRHIFRVDPLEHTWDVTSDTIAAYTANELCAKKLILVTNVDGIFSNDPRQNSNLKQLEKISANELFRWNKRTSVDKILPKMLLQTKLECYVVNGKHPERIKLILEDRQTICTHITV